MDISYETFIFGHNPCMFREVSVYMAMGGVGWFIGVGWGFTFLYSDSRFRINYVSFTLKEKVKTLIVNILFIMVICITFLFGRSRGHQWCTCDEMGHTFCTFFNGEGVPQNLYAHIFRMYPTPNPSLVQ